MYEAEQFLTLLDPTATKFLFVTFDDCKNKNYNLTRNFYGTFAEHKDTLADLNSQGAGIFVTVNKTKGNRRRKEDFIIARAIWQEDDIDSTKRPDIQPHIIVESSPNHFHRYWLTIQTDIPRWERAQLQMVRHFDSDPGAKDIARVLRLPGFRNNKRNADVRLLSITSHEPYSWEEMERALLIPQPETHTNSAANPPPQESTLSQYVAQIKSGEHLHAPLRAIMMINANKGEDREYNKVICTGLISACPDLERQAKAAADLDSMLDATYRKIAEETPPPIIFSPRIELDLDWPPGLMGELAKAANDFFVIPNKTAAIVASISLIAGICGRKYNISTGGLNLYTTIMMPTGAGKDSIRKFCYRVLMDKGMLGTNGMSFLGPQNFTGPKALLTELQARPSMLCVMTEAGLLYKTESGDRSGLTRVILQAYTSSGQHEVIETERYSSQQDSVGVVYSPALTILNEATPVTLLNELKRRESINTGELPRMWIFMLTGKKPYPNPEPHRLNLSAGITDNIRELLNSAYAVQTNSVPDVINIPVPSEYRLFTEECTDIYNRLMEEQPNHAIMYSRASHKVLKVAAILSVLDNPLGTPSISPQMWNWSKKFFEYEMHNIDPIIGNTSDVALAMTKAAHIISKLLKGEYTGKNKTINSELRARGIFTESTFKQAASNIPSIRDAGTSMKYGSPKSGSRVMLEYLLAEGYVTKAVIPRSKGFQVTKLFSDYCATLHLTA